MFQGMDQECAEAASRGIGEAEVILSEEPRKKLLGQVSRVLRGVTATPDKDIEGIPVSVAELFQGVCRLGRGRISRRQDHAPVGGGETRMTIGNRGCS
jgi:hypothetical protein